MDLFLALPLKIPRLSHLHGTVYFLAVLHNIPADVTQPPFTDLEAIHFELLSVSLNNERFSYVFEGGDRLLCLLLLKGVQFLLPPCPVLLH